MQAVAEVGIGPDEADALFRPLENLSAIAACVSGGPDSLALLHLLAEWRERRATGPRLEVFTVDHGLRSSSAEEAEMVRDLAERRYGLPGSILHWEGRRPVTGIEEAARNARYRLLAAAARERSVSHLVLAHHQDDQAETVLMRLARGSSVYGLAGMRPSTALEELVLFRPFLGVPKARLAATVAAAGLIPADDESNRDGRLLRARLRTLLPTLAEEGLDASRLSAFAATMARVGEAIDHYVDGLMSATISSSDGVVRLRLGPYLQAPEEVRLRLLSRLLQSIGGGVYPARSERLQRLADALWAEGGFRRTLAGVVVSKAEGIVTFRPETGNRLRGGSNGRPSRRDPSAIHLPVGSKE